MPSDKGGVPQEANDMGEGRVSLLSSQDVPQQRADYGRACGLSQLRASISWSARLPGALGA